VAGARRELLALDPNVVLMEAQPYERLIAISLLPVRLGATLIGGLAALAMLLAGLGLYGVIASGVNRRTREIGIRMALGAGRRRVLGQVLREAFLLVLVGGLAGLGLAALGARALSSVLHVPPLDPISYLTAAAFLAVVTAVAAVIPARRAAGVDPLVALRT
jgi:ABC-type antimicrobial peptide transport system permease subunit